uniref:Uncharacterized protein n=1 Tax=Glossina pallidipes TaxID=7398 RepID=A0A1A9ZGX4_GLOPL
MHDFFYSRNPTSLIAVNVNRTETYQTIEGFGDASYIIGKAVLSDLSNIALTSPSAASRPLNSSKNKNIVIIKQNTVRYSHDIKESSLSLGQPSEAIEPSFHQMCRKCGSPVENSFRSFKPRLLDIQLVYAPNSSLYMKNGSEIPKFSVFY